MKYNIICYALRPNMNCVCDDAINLETLGFVLPYLTRARLRWREAIMLLESAKHFPIRYTVLIFPTNSRGSNVVPISQREKLGLEPRNLAGECGKLNVSGS